MAQRLAFMNARVMDDPTAHYEDLLASEPFRDDDIGLWVVARDRDVRAVLRDTVNYSNRLTLFPHYPLCDDAMAILGQLQEVPATTAGGDGELHDRARSAIRVTFPTSVTRAQKTMGSIVSRRVDQLVVALPAKRRSDDTVDLIHDFAWELPLRVMLDVLGFPADRYEDFKEWSMGQIALTWGRLEPAEQVRCAQGLVNLWRECQKLVADRRGSRDVVGHGSDAEVPDDMVGRLLTDGTLDEAEIASVILNFAVAGHETTANGIGNAMLDLLSRPGAWAALANRADDVAYVSQVVEEQLGLNPPIIGWSRMTDSDVRVSGVTIPAGERVLLILGAANRDGYRYAAADDRMQRRPGDHLSFGLGAHYCVGAPLARLEMSTALVAAAAAYPEARLRDGFAEAEDKYYPNLGFRALRTLPVTLTPDPA